MEECDMLRKCSFFKKYQETKDLACKGFMVMYCKGTKMNDCKRKLYRQENGKPPLDDMLPTGQIIKT